MSEENKTQSQETTDDSRREFLKKAGKFAVYVPPSIMLLLAHDVEAGMPLGSGPAGPVNP